MFLLYKRGEVDEWLCRSNRGALGKDDEIKDSLCFITYVELRSNSRLAAVNCNLSDCEAFCCVLGASVLCNKCGQIWQSRRSGGSINSYSPGQITAAPTQSLIWRKGVGR